VAFIVLPAVAEEDWPPGPAWRLGHRTGNLHRPRRYNRMLNRALYTSALISIRCAPDSRAF
jgi:hypothetical protein